MAAIDYLCILVFLVFLSHRYLPDDFMQSVVVPLVKAKDW